MSIWALTAKVIHHAPAYCNFWMVWCKEICILHSWYDTRSDISQISILILIKLESVRPFNYCAISLSHKTVDVITYKCPNIILITQVLCHALAGVHDDVIKWKHFPRYWPFVWGIHRSPVNSPYKGQWRGALMLYLICAWINCWMSTGKAGDLIRNRTHCDVTVMASWSAMHFWVSADFVISTLWLNPYIAINQQSPWGNITLKNRLWFCGIFFFKLILNCSVSGYFVWMMIN